MGKEVRNVEKSQIVSGVRPVPSICRLRFEAEENIIKIFVKEHGQDRPIVHPQLLVWRYIMMINLQHQGRDVIVSACLVSVNYL